MNSAPRLLISAPLLLALAACGNSAESGALMDGGTVTPGETAVRGN